MLKGAMKVISAKSRYQVKLGQWTKSHQGVIPQLGMITNHHLHHLPTSLDRGKRDVT
jgi:hypothetical protein